LVIGEKETQNSTIAVRHRKTGDMGQMGVQEFTDKILGEISSKAIG
ncbi:MAG TPA: hypothetical protein DD811_01660, partial [Syntrophomonas sp.]|nr:hypothetical protein [Syntrophomonas sp.]